MVEVSKIGEEEFTISTSMLPLVSIDLIITNSEGLVLLGKRENRPAKGSWFVPGGRIRRMESFNAAFRRISKNELGTSFPLDKAILSGVFEHMYDDSAFSEEIGSHYVSIGLKFDGGEIKIENLPQIQHREYRWFDMQDIRDNILVHERTKEFFVSQVGIRP
jgi:colanic acid biosynthesis protein WcaH